MGYIWLIALAILILFGFESAANFLAVILIGGMILLLVVAVLMAVSELFKLKVWAAIKWSVAAAFFWWLLSICF